MKKDKTLLKEFENAAKAMRKRFFYYAENDETPIDTDSAQHIALETMKIVHEELGSGAFNYALQVIIKQNLDWPEIID